MIERIVILDHENHQVFIEDIDTEVLEKKYNGEEEYIKDNYTLGEFWTWDYITNITYVPTEGDPIDVEPTDLL